ncbi:MAG: hypothetical protein IJT18_04060, partial [Oscillospiraceae bacterium]|nr:hypothetical protein [Oscillospiraceae bacterium]
TAASINNALDSQINYWNKYNDNLAALGDRTGEIEGLSEVIASFADGSEKSVSAIAGMAQASDEELRAMVKKYQQMHDSMQAASEGIATVTSGIPEQVADLEKELSKQIEGMDFGTEAADVARDTLDSYIAAAKDKARSVYAAYAEIARQARLALAVKAPTKDYSGTGGEEGYASGTTNAEAGVHLVGENGPELVYFRGGEQVLNARETASVLSPRGADVTAAGGDHSVYAPVNVDVSIRVDGDASADTVERLNAYGEEFAERVIAVMEERGYNKERMAYR